MPQALRLDAVSLRMRRSGPWLLDGITIDFQPGTITTVTGANGTGKSTLLRLIAGLRRPTSGTVSGRPAHIGFCPERSPGKLRLSTASYVQHLAAIHQRPDLATTPESMLRRMNFLGDSSAPMSSLSKGNVQKVLLATALGLGAPLLVLDEPWSGLDATARTVLSGLLREAAASGRTVVLAEHPDAVDDRPFQRVLELRHGQLTPRDDLIIGEAGRAAIVLRPHDIEPDAQVHQERLGPTVGEIIVAGGFVHVACAGEQVAVWVTTGLFTSEDPVQADIIGAAAGGRWRSHAGRMGAALLISGTLAIFGTLVPIPTQGRMYAVSLLLTGALAHCTGALIGVAIGLCYRRDVIPSTGYSWSIAAILAISAFALPVSPVNWQFAWMSTAHKHAQLVPTLAMALAASAYLAVCFVGTERYLQRRAR